MFPLCDILYICVTYTDLQHTSLPHNHLLANSRSLHYSRHSVTLPICTIPRLSLLAFIAIHPMSSYNAHYALLKHTPRRQITLLVAKTRHTHAAVSLYHTTCFYITLFNYLSHSLELPTTPNL